MPVNHGRASCKRAVDVAVGVEAEAGEGSIHRRFFDLRQNDVKTVKQARDCLLRIAFFCVEQCGAGRGLETSHEDTGGKAVASDVGEEGNNVAVG
jgi:hypothetical protein